MLSIRLKVCLHIAVLENNKLICIYYPCCNGNPRGILLLVILKPFPILFCFGGILGNLSNQLLYLFEQRVPPPKGINGRTRYR